MGMGGIVDAKGGKLSEEQVLTSSADADLFVDFMVADPDQGEGRPIRFVFEVQTELDSGAEGSVLQIVLRHSADNSTWVDLILSPTFAESDEGFAAKWTWECFLPPKFMRYVTAKYLVTTENFTAGKVNAALKRG